MKSKRSKGKPNPSVAELVLDESRLESYWHIKSTDVFEVFFFFFFHLSAAPS